MPTITVNDQGHSLFYDDTGAPPPNTTPYTTVIVVHGTAFHGKIFERLFPLAFQHNLRLIVLNRRDYLGSSPYTEEELQMIKVNNVHATDEFGKSQALELARFIKTFIEKERIPKASNDWDFGGVVLLSWSSGNGYTLPLLAYPDSISENTRETIEPYLRSHVVFDAPRWILGLTPLKQQANPLKLRSLSQEECLRVFGASVTAYYHHKSLTSRNLEDLQFDPGDNSRKSMTLEEVRETTCYSAVFHSEAPIQTANPKIYANRLCRVLFDDETAQKHWPRCRVDVVWCEHSPWESIDVMWNLQAAREKADEEGVIGRSMKFVMMPGTNHFPHWNDPEMTIVFFSGIVNG